MNGRDSDAEVLGCMEEVENLGASGSVAVYCQLSPSASVILATGRWGYCASTCARSLRSVSLRASFFDSGAAPKSDRRGRQFRWLGEGTVFVLSLTSDHWYRGVYVVTTEHLRPAARGAARHSYIPPNRTRAGHRSRSEVLGQPNRYW